MLNAGQYCPGIRTVVQCDQDTAFRSPQFARRVAAHTVPPMLRLFGLTSIMHLFFGLQFLMKTYFRLSPTFYYKMISIDGWPAGR